MIQSASLILHTVTDDQGYVKTYLCLDANDATVAELNRTPYETVFTFPADDPDPRKHIIKATIDGQAKHYTAVIA